LPFQLRVFLKALLLPPAGFLVLGVAGIIVWRRRPRLGFALCAFAIVSVWVIGMPFVADALAHAAENYPVFDPAHPDASAARAQAIVILGGGVRRAPENGGARAPSGRAVWRLIEGARVARAMHLPIVISASPGEADAMRRCLEEDLGMRWIEGTSSTTHENAVFSARLLKPLGIDRIILVTTGMHMARSVREFTRAGFTVSAAPAEMTAPTVFSATSFVPSSGAFDRSYTAFHEFAGRLVR
jgi:uncharacterized SAM-binding protein YcdF (DUF218 family)